jgi:branched-chain amino acid transport system permease protein
MSDMMSDSMSDMVTESGAPVADVVTRGAFDVDWRKIARMGGILAIALAFIALAGMPVGLDGRLVIDPILSLGYLSLLWLPLIVGFAVGHETVLEGMAATRKGARDVVAGAAVGAVGGLGLSVLVVLIDNFDLRDPLVNWSPQLVELLTFDNGIGFGFFIWIVISGAMAAVGGLLHVLPGRAPQALIFAILSVLFVAIFESFLVDVIDQLKFLYGNTGGLTLGWAIVIAVLAAAATLSGQTDRIGAARTAYHNTTGSAKSRQTFILIAVSAVLLIVIPMVTGKITQELMANVGIFLLLALGLNVVVGLAGILDLGYVAFFAIGGYTTAVLTSPNRGPDWPSWVPTLDGPGGWLIALVVTMIFAATAGLLIGAPVIRMRGDYLAIVTLGFGEIIRLLFLSDWLGGYFNGAQGITNIPPADFDVFQVKGTDPRSVFYLALVFSAIAIYISWRLERSRLGRAWMAVREDESVAEAMGINTVNVKLMAFVVGASLASFSGAIFAAKVGSIFPTSFLILISIIILVIVIVGGMGNIVGMIVGSVVLVGVLGGPKQPGLLQEFSQYKLLIYGALLVWMMLKRPEGLVPNVRRSRELHHDEFLQDAWLRGEVDAQDDTEDNTEHEAGHNLAEGMHRGGDPL